MSYQQFLGAWTGLVIRHPGLTLACLALLTLAAGWIAVFRFHIDSNTANLIRQDTEWRRDFEAFKEEFPQFTETSFIVVSGRRANELEDVTRALVDELKRDMTWFQSVHAPAIHPFYREHGLLYADMDALERLATELAEAQPVLTSLAEDPSLRGVLRLFEQAIDSGEPLGGGIERFASILSGALQRVPAGDPTPLDWRNELFPASGSTLYNIVIVQGKLDFNARLPNARIVGQIRGAIERVQVPSGVRVRLTGQSPLDHEEISSARNSAQLAGLVALAVLVLVLVTGVRSPLVILVTYAAMLVGLVWTAAYAMLSIGQYNTISIVFLVMFIGLGVDFAIHLCLRYQEELNLRDRLAALRSACEDIGPALTLCAFSTGLGFLAFTFTDYRGLAELGFISFGGMLIALVVSLTLIPALFAVAPAPAAVIPSRMEQTAARLAVKYEYVIVGLTLLLAAFALYKARDASFDFSTLALKNPNSEAMQTFHELQEQGMVTNYSLSIMAQPDADLAELRRRLLALEVVSEVNGPESAVPERQEDKLLLLEDLGFLLTSAFIAAPAEAPPTDARRLALTAELGAAIRARPPQAGDDAAAVAALEALADELDTLLAGAAPTAALLQLEEVLLAGFAEQLRDLETRLAAGPVRFDDLPEETRARLVSARGRVHLSVVPSQALVSGEALRAFVEEVRKVAKQATGRPAVELGIGDLVQGAFLEAMLYALGGISLLLLVTLRSLTDTLLIFTPLVLTSIFTFAASVVFGIPFNMANVVVIPLVFGLGVDNGVHVVQRFRAGLNLPKLIRSTTLRAVLLSNLTTLGTFGALGLSTHQGIKSIGLLLAFALSCQLLLTLIVLPALLSIFSRGKQAASRPAA